MNICACISNSVPSNAQRMLVRIYGVPCMHEFCAVDVFWNITRRQAISPVNKSHYVLEFNDSAGDIDLYQMSLSQSESTIFT